MPPRPREQRNQAKEDQKLEVFNFVFDGFYLGGKIVVIAKGLRQAKKLAGEFTSDVLELQSREPVDEAGVVYFDDGDY